MSTEAGIVERLKRSQLGIWHHTRDEVIVEAVAEITKLRAERDAAARDMRERCAVAAEKHWPLGTLRHAGTKQGIAADIRALPLIATDRGTND